MGKYRVCGVVPRHRRGASGLCHALFRLRCHDCGKEEGTLTTMRGWRRVFETRWHKREKGVWGSPVRRRGNRSILDGYIN